MDNKRFFIVLLVVVLGFVGFAVYSNQKKSTADNSSAVSSKGSSNVYGKLDSKVTLTEFVDFQCEACYAYYPYVKQVKELYKDKVRFEVRYFPIASGHQFATQAAKNAEAAARQGKFWEMHNKLFEGQKTWEQTQNPQSYFDQYAQEIGLDMNKFNTDRVSSDVNAVVNKDLKDIKELGGSGTPTFVLNGKKLDKNPDPTIEAFSKLLDDALNN
jgi:protein-disulfide isomerase